MKSNNKCDAKSNDKFDKSRNNKSRRNSKSNGRDRRNDTKVESLDKAGRDNDPNWYFNDKVLADQVCHLSFNSFLGEGTVGNTLYAIPSVVSIKVNPSPFSSYDITDATHYDVIHRSGLNLAITKLYTLLASYSGRAANYAPQDVGMMILAMGEIVSMVEDLRRVVGISYTFSPRNRALPKILTTALGYDYDDFIRNRAIYIDRLNAMITRFNSLPILGNVPYILKCRDMYQKVYTDSTSAEATLIVMIPNSTWELDEQSYSGGTILKTIQWNSLTDPYTTFGDHLDVLETMIEALFGSTTLNTIYADLLNLASKVKVEMFKLDYVTNDYIVLPEYNANFLLQLHNADIIGYPLGVGVGPQTLWDQMKYTALNNVYPDPNTNSLIYNPIFKYGLTTGIHTHFSSIVDLPDADPSVENIIEATRFKCISEADYDLDGTLWNAFSCIPDHYFCSIRVFTNDVNPDSNASFSNNWSLPAVQNVNQLLRITAAGSQVDWYPLVYRHGTGSDVSIIVGDLNFYTEIDSHVLGAINRIIAQNLFDFRI